MIAGGDAEDDLGLRRIKGRFGVEDLADARQNLADGMVECHGFVGGAHGRAGHPHQEFVLEGQPQPAQRRAHGRLPQSEAVSRARDIAFGHQGFERDQQIEIRRGEVHGAIQSSI